MIKVKNVVLAVAAMAVVGCAGTQVSMNPGAQTLAERIPDRRPDWADWTQTYREEKGKLVFVGAVRDRGDYALAVREAMAEGTKIAADQLSRDLNLSFRQSAAGSNVGDDIGRQVQDLFVQEARGITIMGLVQREKFAERWQEGTVGGSRQFYNAWALLEIPRVDYLASKQAVLDRAAGRARDTRNAEAQRLLESFMSEIKGSRETARP